MERTVCWDVLLAIPQTILVRYIHFEYENWLIYAPNLSKIRKFLFCFSLFFDYFLYFLIQLKWWANFWFISLFSEA